MEQSENLPLIHPLWETQTSVSDNKWAPAGVSYQVQPCVYFIRVCVCVGSELDRQVRQKWSDRLWKSEKRPEWTVLAERLLILLHYGARHLSLSCRQTCQYKNGNVTVRQHNEAHSQTLFFSPFPFCPFSLWCLSITACTGQFIWKTLLMCCDKHIACKWDSLLEHMVRMFLILKACWLSDSASPNVKHIWKCR